MKVIHYVINSRCTRIQSTFDEHHGHAEPTKLENVPRVSRTRKRHVMISGIYEMALSRFHRSLPLHADPTPTNRPLSVMDP